MLFRHPHLVRGIVHTPHGAFAINRGLADLPEEIGDSLGWSRTGDAPLPPHLTRDADRDEQPTANPAAAR